MDKRRTILNATSAVASIAVAEAVDGEQESQEARVLPKTRSFFDTIELMDEDEFGSHFRMKRGKINNYLQ